MHYKFKKNPHSPYRRTRPKSIAKVNSVDTEEEFLKNIKRTYNCNILTQHGIVPATRIPNADQGLRIEHILLFSFAFSEKPWVISKMLIMAQASEMQFSEKSCIPNLIEKANESPMCDDDDEGIDMVFFFHNFVAVPMQYKLGDNISDYVIAYSEEGFHFEIIWDEVRAKELFIKDPESVYFLRVIAKDVR